MLSPAVLSAQVTLLQDALNTPPLDTAVRWSSAASSGFSVSIVNGALALAGTPSSYGGAYAVGRTAWVKGGVYDVNLDWKPGATTNAFVPMPAVFFHDVRSLRDPTWLTPTTRYLRLDLGNANDAGTSRRTSLGLYGASAAGGEVLLASATLASPVATSPDPAAVFHHIHLQIDFDQKRARVELDGAAVMSGVDLTRSNAGAAVSFLNDLALVVPELTASDYFSTLVENFGNFVLTGPPQLDAANPVSGRVGTTVTFNGSGFGAAQGTGFVSLGSSRMTVQSWSDSQIVATIPLSAPLGLQIMNVTTNAGAISTGRPFTVVGAQIALIEDNFNGAALDPALWNPLAIAPSTATVAGGYLTLSNVATQPVSRAATAFSTAKFARGGVFQLNVDWLPGQKKDAQGHMPGIYLTEVRAPRFFGVIPNGRSLRLDLGTDADVGNNPQRSAFVLYEEGLGANLSLIKSAPLPAVLATTPDPTAVFHHLHLVYDFNQNLFSVDLDGQPVMANVDLTRDSLGGATQFTSFFSQFNLELFGGDEYFPDKLVESYDTVLFDGPPQLLDESPISGRVGEATTLSGLGFGAAAGQATVGATPLQIQSWTDSKIVALIPPSASSGTQTLVVAAAGLRSAPRLFSVVPAAFPALEDGFAGPSLSTSVWTALTTGLDTVSISSGILLESNAALQNFSRGATLYGNLVSTRTGVWDLDFDWRPGSRSDGNGFWPAIYLRDSGAARDAGGYLEPTERFLRLDLGQDADLYQPARSGFVLYGKGAGAGAPLSSIKTIALPAPILQYPDPTAVLHHVHLRADFNGKTFSVDLDGQPLASNVDLTRDSLGNQIGFLGDLRDFQVELYGGSQYYNWPGFVEAFDTVILNRADGAPQAQIAAPTNGAFLRGLATVAGTAAGTAGLDSVQFSIDGIGLGFTKPPVFSFAWNTTSVADGSHILTLQAKDALGQVGTSPAVNVTVDNSSPTALISLADGLTLSRPLTVVVTATDAVSGVASVSFSVDGAVQSVSTAPPYAFYWDTRLLADGPHTLFAAVLDRAGNEVDFLRRETINYAPPGPPVILSPAANFATAVATIAVSGASEAGTTVQVMVNGLDAATAAVGAQGQWSTAATLSAQGPVSLTALAFEQRGFSGPSAAVAGLYTTKAPGAPAQVAAGELSGGRASLSWAAPVPAPSFYRVYRSTDDLKLVAGSSAPASLRVADNVAALTFTDLTPFDDLWFYGVTAVDLAGNESVLSGIVYAVTDRVPPTASVALSAPSPLGPGVYRATLTISEPLMQLPLLTLTPPVGQPVALSLSGVTATLWQAAVTITAGMGAGVATMTFQGTDLAGNVGVSASTTALDTAGPAGSVTLSKTSPLSIGPLTLTLSLTKPAVATPTLSVTPQGGAAIPVAVTGGPSRWSGTLTVGTTTGDGLAVVAFSATDALGNVGTTLAGGTTAFVIDTVAPAPPQFVRANPGPGGVVTISWSAPFGERPAYYHVYRDSVLLSTNVPAAADGSGVYVDTPGDGTHTYQVSSLDLAGNESAATDPTATARSTAPPPPVNVAAVVNAFNQIQVSWQSASTATASYRLYRTTYSLSSVMGLPFRNAVSPFTEAPAVDAFYHYAVTALDGVGNESGPSNEATVLWDKGSPQIAFSFTNGAYFNANVTPSFAATDVSLDTSSVHATLDGQPFVTGTTVSAEGPHTLAVTAANTTGHVASAQAAFTIDKTPPSIAFTGVGSGASVVASSVAVSVQVADLSPVTTSFTLVNALLGTSLPYNSGDPISRNGQYTLTAVAIDAAGNGSTATLSFALEAGPVAPANLSVAVLSQSALVSWVKPEPDVLYYRVYRDGARVSASLYAGTFFQDSGYTPGAHVYEVSAVDAQGVEGARARATIPAAALTLAATTLTRGFFDAISPQVHNNAGASAVFGPATLQLSDGLTSATVAAATLGAGQTALFQGVVATPVGLPGALSVHVSVALPTDPGATAFLAGDFALTAQDPVSPVVEVNPNPLVPGAQSPVQVVLHNRGSAPLDVITAQVQNGTFTSVNNVAVQVLTTAGTLLASGNLLQAGNGANATFSGGRQVFFVTVPAGGAFSFDPVNVVVPNTAAGSLSVTAAVSTPTYDLAGAALPGTRAFSSAVAQAVTGQVPYTATVAPDRAVYDQNATVSLTGQALSGGQPVPNAAVTVHVISNGFDRRVSTTTDNLGNYTAQYVPAAGEAGQYSLFAADPSVVTHAAQAAFTIVGFGYDVAAFNATEATNSSLPFTVHLQNTGATALTGLSFSISTGSGSGLSLTLDPGTLPSTLAAGAQASLNLVVAAGIAASSGTVNLIVSESHGFKRTLPVNVTVVPAQVIPVVTPSQFSIGLLAGAVRTVNVTIANKGFDTWRSVTLTQPALSWVTINGGLNLGDLAPGAQVGLTLTVAPPGGTFNQLYQATPLFQITSLNVAAVPVNAAIAVTSALVGNVAVSVINGDKPKDSSGNGVPIPGALVTLVSQDVAGLTLKATCDQNGVAQITNVPAGNYQWRAETQGFQTMSSTVLVEPGMTNSLLAVLATAVVSYQWTVVPTSIPDKYDITLGLTFRTDVPAPVITVDPPTINIEMTGGQTAFTQFTLTNKGLVKATNVALNFSGDSAMQVELPFSSLPELGAGQSVVVPIKVTLLHASCHTGQVSTVYAYTCSFGAQLAGACQPVQLQVGSLVSCGVGATGNLPGQPNGAGVGNVFGNAVAAASFLPGGTPAPMCGGALAPKAKTHKPKNPCSVGGGSTNPGTGQGSYQAPGGGAPAASPSLMITPTHRFAAGDSWFGLMLPFGVGWYANYFESVSYDANDWNGEFIVRDGQGGTVGFQQVAPPVSVSATVGAGGQCATAVYHAVFVGPPGVHDQLTTSDFQSFTSCDPLAAIGGGPPTLDYRMTDGTVIHFKQAGQSTYLPSLLTDRNGNTVTYTRDANQRLTKLTDVHGRTVQFAYNANGNVTSILDNAGNQETFGYTVFGASSAVNLLTNVTDVDGDVTAYSYDFQGQLTQIAYPNGGIHTYSYAGGQVRSESDDQGNNLLTYSYVNNGSSGTTTVTDALGHATKYEWQDFSGLRQTTAITDPAGNKTAFEYSQDAMLISQTDPLGRTTKFTYDAQGNVTSVVDPAGATTQTTYEPVFNQPTSVTDPKGGKTTLAYDGAGDLVQTQDAANNFTLMGYDKQGHVTAIKDPLGGVSGFSYNGNGGLASATDPLGRTDNMTRDPLGRLTQDVDPAGKQTNFSYDPAGNTTQLKDALNGITGYGYQAGRGPRQLHTLSDANSHATTFGYDVVGRQTSLTTALNQSSSIAYDKNGNPVTLTTKNGQAITLTYDALHRVTKMALPEGNIDYTYDVAGNLLTASKYNGTTLAFVYDKLNRVTQEIQTLPNGFQVTLGQTYDANGNRTGLSTPWGSFSYAYDSRNRMTSVTNPYNQTVSYAYDANGRVKSKTYPNGTQTTYAYDAAGQVTQVMHRRVADNSVIAFDNYAYDAAGNRTSVTDAAGTHTFGYDKLNRLTSATHPAASGLPILNEIFSYDATGNRAADSSRTGYTYNQAGSLVSDSSSTYSYDGDGNRLTAISRWNGSQTTYSYDSEDRLTHVSNPDGSGASYKFDALGRRVERLIGVPVGATIIRYVYDGKQILATLDGANNLTALSTNGPGIDNLLATRKGANDYFFHQDFASNVVGITDSSTNLVESVMYEAFGQPAFKDGMGQFHQTSTLDNSFLFAGRELDQEATAYYFRQRVMDFSTGLFLQADPLREVLLQSRAEASRLSSERSNVSGPQVSDLANPYFYAAANPVNRSDPLGLMSNPAGNGNFGGPFTPQDWVCSDQAAILNTNSCARNCCAYHDLCYQDNQCNSSSWIGNLYPVPYTACGRCNAVAVSCVLAAVANPKCGPPPPGPPAPPPNALQCAPSLRK